jgi:iron(III) transport system ATP-binding protein
MISRPILQLHQVTRQFSRRVQPAVCAVSLSVQPGDLLALLGPSGCGKTTLLRLIAGFEPLQEGTIDIAEQRVAGEGQWVPPEQRGVGMVFQDYALFPHLTVRQNVEFGLGNRYSRVERFKDVLAIVRLEGMENRYPHQLSGGQQQRVALARALAPNPALILLDEPLSNLDVQVRLRLRQELRTILKTAGASAVFVTHDQEEALSIADQVAVMCQGCLEQIGTPEQLYQQPASRFVAEFVTQANLIPAQRQGCVWHTEIGDIPIAKINSSSDTADLMVRQEDLILTPDDTSSIVIGDRQFLGREYSYMLYLPSKRPVIARTPITTCLDINTPVQVAIAAEKIQTYPRP